MNDQVNDLARAMWAAAHTNPMLPARPPFDELDALVQDQILAMAQAALDFQDCGDGIIAIATERARQVSIKGYTREHDDQHGPVELINAALAYTVQAQDRISEAEGHGVGADGPETYWPWNLTGFKFSDDEIQSLTKAGALIAAALDAAIARRANQ